MADLLKEIIEFISNQAIVNGVPLRIVIAGIMILLLLALMVRWGTESEMNLQAFKTASVEKVMIEDKRPTFETYVSAISQINSDFMFLGISAKRFLSQPGMEDKLVELAKSGNQVRFLILNPGSPNLDRKAKEEGDDPAAIVNDINSSIVRVQKINAKYGTNIQLRLYDELPLWRIIIFGHTMHISYFAGGRQGIDTPVLELRKSSSKENSTFYRAFEAHIHELWNTRSKNAI